jgi:3-methyladenine DNA glycosylase AlkD
MGGFTTKSTKGSARAAGSGGRGTIQSLGVRVATALAWLERRGTKAGREGMARYGLVASKVFGVSVAEIRQLAKTLGRDHALADALMKTGWYEARLLAAFVAVPGELTAAQMDSWIKRCENWGDVDTLCFHCFDRTPLAWGRINVWAKRKDEFVRRAAFALIASLALHDKKAPDGPFLKALPLIAAAADDARNFVKKGVSWALRGIGHRNPALRAKAIALGERLAASEDAASRWVGKDVLRDLRRER